MDYPNRCNTRRDHQSQEEPFMHRLHRTSVALSSGMRK